MINIKDQPVFCSWSGGKDSCLALYHAIEQGSVAKALLTMMIDNGKHSRSHGLPLSLIQKQAESLGIPLTPVATSWADYEKNFLSTIKNFRSEGIVGGVFGDIDLQGHLDWVQGVCKSANIDPHEPLWKRPRRDLLSQFFELNFEATIVAIKEGVLGNEFLGRKLDNGTVAEMEAIGIDASGEEGEYHTVVTDGPLFSSPIEISIGQHISHDGYCFAEILTD